MTARRAYAPEPAREAPSVRDVIGLVLGADEAAAYRASKRGPSFAGIAACERDRQMASTIAEMNAAYAARGHAK